MRFIYYCSTGIIRRIDGLGRVVIPRETRRYLGIKEGDPLEISVEDNKICFERYHPCIIEEFNSIMGTITDFYNGEDKKQMLTL